ncbi:MAG: 2-hydroxychromene-2-carboxylate isomerase [Salinarimonadaceae bacterium]|nr:MAG: 2-hydroxychromene-2-carboxylate isomerase [Salinarimonadaceae bacterium]
MARLPVIEFWYEFASTYSYLSAMRIEDAATAAGVDIRWRPFLLGPIFSTQGWNTSPFNIYPAKGRYMWRDMEREAARTGLRLRRPAPFPQNSLTATRVALLGADEPWGPTFSRAVFDKAFGEGLSIEEPSAIRDLVALVGLDSDSIMRNATAEANKTRLRAVTEEARSRGLFGAPTFFTEDGEMFWGNDRLDQALAWATGDRPSGVR